MVKMLTVLVCLFVLRFNGPVLVCLFVLRLYGPVNPMVSHVEHGQFTNPMSSKQLISIVHILSPETDNCPS